MFLGEGFRKWCQANGLEARLDEFLSECDEIAAQCEEEGYPANGSNYDLRVTNLMRRYPELFAEEEDDWEYELRF